MYKIRNSFKSIRNANTTSSSSRNKLNLQTWDDDISLFLYHHIGKVIPRPFLLFIEYSGSALITILIFLFWITPSSFITAEQKGLLLNILFGNIVDLILVGLIKITIKRKRPIYNNLNDHVIVVKLDKYSSYCNIQSI